MQVWKYVERLAIILGLLLSAFVAYIEGAEHYGWDRPAKEIAGYADATAPAPSGHAVGSVTPVPSPGRVPSQFLFTLVGLSILLLATGWVMIAIRRKSRWNPDGLYVGQIHFDLSKLSSDLRIEIAVRCFNGTGVSLDIKQINGGLVYYPTVQMNSPDAVRLENAQFLEKRSPMSNLKPNSEMSPVIVQHVPRELEIRLSQSLSQNERPCFSFDDLDILVSPTEDPSISRRLPLWNGLTLDDTTGRLVGRVIVAKLEAGFRFKASVK